MPAGGHCQARGEELTEQAGGQHSINGGGPCCACLLLNEHHKPEAVNEQQKHIPVHWEERARQASVSCERDLNVGPGDRYTQTGWSCEDSKHSSSHKRPCIGLPFYL